MEILLFAHLQEAIGQPKITVDLPACTVGELKAWMASHYPNVAVQQVMVAVNEEFATDATVIEQEDTIAFIPPISGG
ncbi:molybdopterin converting factor subunit 1 [Lysinibacillus piscis]|uniref:Molybdopterin synthase sulfur carrier subunit n=1 Tax=Lysinibacillus piscis TaxID=2518931 RepID=A0ABQ5NF48_9BACI|nr:molybdopterin converting factor subunit 1 [Lysinibacillus sp. KH24]GLC87011.1 molybdopterin synthase sulfur carrier subunit [Lysinibacillus sp. KH24]